MPEVVKFCTCESVVTGTSGVSVPPEEPFIGIISVSYEPQTVHVCLLRPVSVSVASFSITQLPYE